MISYLINSLLPTNKASQKLITSGEHQESLQPHLMPVCYHLEQDLTPITPSYFLICPLQYLLIFPPNPCMTQLILDIKICGQQISKLPKHISRWSALAFTLKTISIVLPPLYPIAPKPANVLRMMNKLSITLTTLSQKFC